MSIFNKIELGLSQESIPQPESHPQRDRELAFAKRLWERFSSDLSDASREVEDGIVVTIKNGCDAFGMDNIKATISAGNRSRIVVAKTCLPEWLSDDPVSKAVKPRTGCIVVMRPYQYKAFDTIDEMEEAIDAFAVMIVECVQELGKGASTVER